MVKSKDTEFIMKLLRDYAKEEALSKFIAKHSKKVKSHGKT